MYHEKEQLKPEPTDLEEVRIGYLGPLEGSVLVPQGIQMLQGCKLAVEEANKKGRTGSG